ncbi:MAG: FtsW/RodA/SpoVE family cell cycle protein [Oscillospiraceae bacterium]|nr:FtsW/RodA/SpoVE family cell cycle protein [Oscillospiraceae bacterium]
MPSAAIYSSVLTAVARYVVPILTAILLYRCIKPLVSFHREAEIWGWLYTSDGNKHPITHWETVIGSGKNCDLRLSSAGVEKQHAVVTRYDDGSWSVISLHHAPIRANGHHTEALVIESGDYIKIGEETVRFIPVTAQQADHFSYLRDKAPAVSHSLLTLLLLTGLQTLFGFCYAWGQPKEIAAPILFGFGGLAAAGWLMLILYSFWGRTALEAEILALYLCTLGMCVICAVCPEETYKQLFAVFLGIGLFFVLGWILRDLERAKRLRCVFAIAGLLLLWITFLFGRAFNGAKSWLILGNFSVQPSELAKISLIFAGAAAMDRWQNKWGLLAFCLYGILCCVCLGLSNDFGSALVFFLVFAVLGFLRSGILGTCVAAGGALAGAATVAFVPRVKERFSTWGHIWEDTAGSGFQQTRALSCLACGGLLGLGANESMMKNLFSSASDMAAATLAEQWGLFSVIGAVISVLTIALFAVRGAVVARSSFYAIGVLGASALLTVQMMLNFFGMVDILPLTGVTFPFVSNGGTAMLCTWGILAFLVAADTRPGSGFGRKGRGNYG